MSQPMIRPHQVDSLPFLDAQQKAQYKNGLANLWAQYEGSEDNSAAKNEAKNKLLGASQKIMQQITARNRPGGAAGTNVVAPGQQRPPQNGQPAGQQAAAAQNSQPAQQAQAKPQQAQGQPNADPDAALKQKISTEVNAVVVYPSPENTTQAQFEQYKQTFKTQLGTYRFKAEKARDNLRALEKHKRQIEQQSGQAAPTDVSQRLAHVKGVFEQCMNSAQDLMIGNDRNKRTALERKNLLNQNRPQPPTNGAQSTTPRPPTQPGIQSVAQEGQVTGSPAQAQAPGLPQQRQAQQQQTAAQSARPISQQSVAQQPQRPPINPQAAQQYSSYSGPNSAVPQSANPGQQRPHALSQQGAIAKAQEQNFAQSTALQQPQLQQPQPGPNGFNQAPPQGTPTSATPNQAQGTINHKLPIPKTLPVGAQSQVPVSGPPARPTMGHGGMMNVPGVQKPPPFQLEGEGDHVLSKRKLDELVRQVTGSTNPADGLTPEVEEAVLTLTDDFVDNVITKACQMAKLRQGQTLEIRDIQLVLERNYGIRIPGYALDEVRAVRKFQPGAGWIAKVQAVQAGKVMGGNRDA